MFASQQKFLLLFLYWYVNGCIRCVENEDQITTIMHLWGRTLSHGPLPGAFVHSCTPQCTWWVLAAIVGVMHGLTNNKLRINRIILWLCNGLALPCMAPCTCMHVGPSSIRLGIALSCMHACYSVYCILYTLVVTNTVLWLVKTRLLSYLETLYLESLYLES